jgi:hypothetical protein
VKRYEPTTYEAGGCRCCGARLYAELDLVALRTAETQSWEVYHVSPRCERWKSGDRNACIPLPATYIEAPEVKEALAENTRRVNERFANDVYAEAN